MKLTHAVRTAAAVGTSALMVLAAAPANASGKHGSPPIRTITSNLDGPFGLDVLSSKRALVAESDAG
jgi:hypothetical protein